MEFSVKANSKTKKKIIQAIEMSSQGQFAKSFATQDFVRLPYADTVNYARTYWASHVGDVTVLVWERGEDVHDWRVQIQCW